MHGVAWRGMWICVRSKGGEIRDTKTLNLSRNKHCFVASFCRCFPFFTLRDQLDPQQKHLLRVEEMQRADWLIRSGTSKFVARQVASLMKNEQQNQNLLLKVDPGSTFHTNFLQPATNVFVAGQVDRAR